MMQEFDTPANTLEQLITGLQPSVLVDHLCCLIRVLFTLVHSPSPQTVVALLHKNA